MREPMEMFPAVTTIAQTIQLSLSPVFMLAGIAGVLNLLAGRLSRVIDRGRVLEQLHPGSTGREHDRHVWELRLLDRRMRGINRALSLCTGSAIATCAVVALLFVGELATLRIGTVVALIFILAMLMLIAGLVMFALEVRLSVRDADSRRIAALIPFLRQDADRAEPSLCQRRPMRDRLFGRP